MPAIMPPADSSIQTEPASSNTWTGSGFDEVYRDHSRAIYYLTLGYLGDPSLAEDATHDVFLKAYRKLDSFRGDASLRTWLYRIAVNHCQNLLQSWHRRRIVTCLDDDLSLRQPASDDNPLRILAYELLVATNAIRNLVREGNKHMLKTAMQTGGKEGMILMDACIYDLYCRCLISYDTALSRARHPDRIAKNYQPTG